MVEKSFWVFIPQKPKRTGKCFILFYFHNSFPSRLIKCNCIHVSTEQQNNWSQMWIWMFMQPQIWLLLNGWLKREEWYCGIATLWYFLSKYVSGFSFRCQRIASRFIDLYYVFIIMIFLMEERSGAPWFLPMFFFFF